MYSKAIMSLSDLAKLTASKSPMKESYGALLVYRGKVISKGYNNYSGKIRRIQNSCIL